jgi:hypothetical protein
VQILQGTAAEMGKDGGLLTLPKSSPALDACAPI